MPDLHCPSCDRRLTPDHRCLSRRVFLFGAMAGLIRPPKLYDMAAIEKVLPQFASDRLPQPIFTVGPELLDMRRLNDPGYRAYLLRKISSMPGPFDAYPSTNRAFMPMAIRTVNLKEPG